MSKPPLRSISLAEPKVPEPINTRVRSATDQNITKIVFQSSEPIQKTTTGRSRHSRRVSIEAMDLHESMKQQLNTSLKKRSILITDTSASTLPGLSSPNNSTKGLKVKRKSMHSLRSVADLTIIALRMEKAEKISSLNVLKKTSSSSSLKTSIPSNKLNILNSTQGDHQNSAIALNGASNTIALNQASINDNAEWRANVAEVKRLEQNLFYAGTLAQSRPEDADLTPKLCSVHLNKIISQSNKSQTLAGYERKKTCQDYVRLLVYGHVKCKCNQCSTRCQLLCHSNETKTNIGSSATQSRSNRHHQSRRYQSNSIFKQMHKLNTNDNVDDNDVANVNGIDDENDNGKDDENENKMDNETEKNETNENIMDENNESDDDDEDDDEDDNYITCVPFDILVLTMIVLNAILIIIDQALENEIQQEEYQDMFQIFHALEFVFMALFTIETLLRLYALKCKRYLFNFWNTFDLIIVIMGWVALISTITQDQTSSSNVTSLRLLRLARILRTTKYFKGVLTLLKVIKKQINILMMMSIFLMFSVLIFAALGMQMYGSSLHKRCAYIDPFSNGTQYVRLGGWCNSGCGSASKDFMDNQNQFPQNHQNRSQNQHWKECNGTTSWSQTMSAKTTCSLPYSTCVMTDGSDTIPNQPNHPHQSNRPNRPGPLNFVGFEYMFKSILTIMYISVGDSIGLLRDRLGDTTNLWASSAYVYVVLCCIVTPFTSMLTSVICAGLNTVRDAFFRNKKQRGLSLSTLRKKKKKRITSNGSKVKEKNQSSENGGDIELIQMNATTDATEKEDKDEEDKEEQEEQEEQEDKEEKEDKEEEEEKEEKEIEHVIDVNDIHVMETKEKKQKTKVTFKNKLQKRLTLTSRGGIQKTTPSVSPKTTTSNCLTPIVTSRPYELIVLGVILFNTGFLCYEAFQNSGEIQEWIVWIEVFFTIIFVLEMVSKMIGLGFLSYFHNKWNFCDFVVVVFAVLVSILEMQIIFNGSSSSGSSNNGNNNENDIKGLISFRSVRLFRISRVTRVARAASMFGALRRLTDLITDTFVSVLEVQMMILISIAVVALAMSTQTGTFGDRGLCTSGDTGVLQFIHFRTFINSYSTLSLTFSWNYIFEIFHGCLTIQDTTDALLYLAWLFTVVALGPKLITAIVVANFEASDGERRDFVVSRQFYLENLHLQELKLQRAIHILRLKKISTLEIEQLETISSALMRLKVSVLNKYNGFPSHDIRHLHVILTKNILNVRLIMLERSLLHSFQGHEHLYASYQILKKEMVNNLSWCALRPMNQMDFVLGLLEIFSAILGIEGASATRFHQPLTDSPVLSRTTPIFDASKDHTDHSQVLTRKNTQGAFDRVLKLTSLVQIMGDNNDMPDQNDNDLVRSKTIDDGVSKWKKIIISKVQFKRNSFAGTSSASFATSANIKETTLNDKDVNDKDMNDKDMNDKDINDKDVNDTEMNDMETDDKDTNYTTFDVKNTAQDNESKPSWSKCMFCMFFFKQFIFNYILCMKCFPIDANNDNSNSIRNKMKSILHSKKCETCTLILLFISFIFACIPSSITMYTFNSTQTILYIEIIWTFIYFMETYTRWIFQWNSNRTNAIFKVLLFDTLIVLGMCICLYLTTTTTTTSTTVLATTVSSTSVSSSSLVTYLSICRAIRVLRSLRCISYNSRMTAVINTICSQWTSILNVFLLFGLIFFVYAITGGFLYASDYHLDRNVTEWCDYTNTFRKLNNPKLFRTASKNQSTRSMESMESIGSIPSVPFVASVADQCDLRLIDELNVVPGYSNLHFSMMTLIQLSTLDNVTILFIRLTNIHSYSSLLYILSFLMIVPFFLSNLFIAIFAMTVTSTPGRNTMLSKQQNLEVTQTHDTYGASPICGQRRAPTNYLQNLIFLTICESDGSFKGWFQITISIVLFLDMMLALSVPNNSSVSESTDNTQLLHTVVRFVFFSIYTIEIVLKMVALGPKIYLCRGSRNGSRNSKNIINLIDTLLILIVFILFISSSILDSKKQSTLFTLLLKLRYFRLMTHFVVCVNWFAFSKSTSKINSTIYQLKEVVTKSSRAIFNIIEFYLLITGIWCVIGVCMFARNTNTNTNNNNNIDINSSSNLVNLVNRTTIQSYPVVMNGNGYSDVTYGMNENNNFDNIFYSFITLIRIATIDHWSELYRSCLRINSNYTLTSLYFIIYIIITGPILKSLSIAVLYSQFSRVQQINVSKGTVVSARDKHSFQQIWLKYDPKGDGFISSEHIILFLKDLRKFEQLQRKNGMKGINKNPRMILTSKLLNYKKDPTSSSHSKSDSMSRFTHRMLVPSSDDHWLNSVVAELIPHARLVNSSLVINSLNRSDFSEELEESKRTTKTKTTTIKTTWCWKPSEKKVVSAVTFRRVLILLVQKRLHEHAFHLQCHFEQKHSSDMSKKEDRIEATRCPVCKLNETAMIEEYVLKCEKRTIEEEEENHCNTCSELEQKEKENGDEEDEEEEEVIAYEDE